VANLAALVVAVGHFLGSLLCKMFPADLHQMPNVMTSRDVVEACFMKRAPLLGVGSMVTPTDPPAPTLLPPIATGPGPMTMGFFGAHLLALFFVATGATPEGVCFS
jgi:hypothetical protein